MAFRVGSYDTPLSSLLLRHSPKLSAPTGRSRAIHGCWKCAPAATPRSPGLEPRSRVWGLGMLVEGLADED